LAVYDRVSGERLDKEQHQQASGEVGKVQNSRQASGQRQTMLYASHTSHTDENVDTVESLVMSQEDKPQSHLSVREISREAGDPSVVSFADYSQGSASQVLQEKVRSTAD